MTAGPPFAKTVQVVQNAAPAEERLRLPSEASESHVVLRSFRSLRASVAPVAPVGRPLHSAVWEPGVRRALWKPSLAAPAALAPALTLPVVAFSGQGEMAPMFHQHIQAQDSRLPRSLRRNLLARLGFSRHYPCSKTGAFAMLDMFLESISRPRPMFDLESPSLARVQKVASPDPGPGL